MNFQLSSAEEWIDDKCAGKLGDMLIRCNNVLHLREVSALMGGGGGGGML
jgi:small nuclear ribonucleoprotein F